MGNHQTKEPTSRAKDTLQKQEVREANEKAYVGITSYGVFTTPR